MEENTITCKTCGNSLTPEGICVDCTLTDFKVSGALMNGGLGGVEKVISAHLVHSRTQKYYDIHIPKAKIGRDPSNQIIIDEDPFTSRFHAWIAYEDGRYFIEDLESANGTLLNGSPLLTRRPLVNGDRLRIGRSDFIFELKGLHAENSTGSSIHAVSET